METVITKVSTQKISRLLTKNGFCRAEGTHRFRSEAFDLENKYSSGIAVYSCAIGGEYNDDTAAYCKKMIDLLLENGYSIPVVYDNCFYVSGIFDQKATIELAKQRLMEAINEYRTVLGGQMDEILLAALQGKVSL
jgi:hypothetical protein